MARTMVLRELIMLFLGYGRSIVLLCRAGSSHGISHAVYSLLAASAGGAAPADDVAQLGDLDTCLRQMRLCR